jgi:hypothetical protein
MYDIISVVAQFMADVAGVEAQPWMTSSVWWHSSWLTLLGLKPNHV